MKKILLLSIALLSLTVQGQLNILPKNSRLAITKNVKQNEATRMTVQDSISGELNWILKPDWALKSDLPAPLGYVPYNSSNPNGFITATSLVPYLTTTMATSTYQPIGTYLTSYTETDPLALKLSNNFSDLSNVVTARTNLGLGTLALSNATIPTNTNQLTNGNGFISGITSGNVTTALGYTPYDATNPNNYISSVPAQSFASLTGKPITLSGYGITDAYSSSNPNNYITSSALSPYLLTATASSTYQPILVSGTNLKTIDGVSFLGSGNIITHNENLLFYDTDFLVNSVNQFHFFGAVISSGTSAANATNLTGNHPGVVRIGSSTSTNSGFRFETDVAAFLLKGNESFISILNPITLTNSTIRIGFIDIVTVADAVDGAYFEIPTSGAVVLKTANNSVRTTSPTITTLSLNTWYKFKITVNSNATSVLGEVFDSTGTLISSQTVTTNIPTGAGRNTGCGIVATNSNVVITPIVDLDYLAVGFNVVR